MRKTSICLLVALLCTAFLFAEPDNGKILPKAEIPQFSNVFLEGTGGLAFPLSFVTQDFLPMTSFGGEFSVGFGYNWDGWLFGFEFSRNIWGQGVGEAALMQNFSNNLFLFKFQRVLSHNTIKKFPAWFELVPGGALGLNCITTDYYPSERAKSEGRLVQVAFGQDGTYCMFYRLSLEASFYLNTDLFIPYVGGDYSLFYDTSLGGGFAGFWTAFVGIRTYPLSFGRDIAAARQRKHDAMIASWGDAVCAIKANPNTDFTPDNDGVNDTTLLTPSVTYLEFDPESWTITILDPQGNIFRSWSGTGALPQNLTWDGKSDSGEIAFSRDMYTAKLSVIPSEADRTRTGKDLLEATDVIKTGILFEEIVPKQEWKIIVNTIYFDPDAATFNKISDEQRQSNTDTLDSIYRQIMEHGNVNVVVEGYANNVSNTEEENTKELIPLSQSRAEVIMQLLIERGLKAENLSAKGYGGANPLAAWEDHANWWKNRRVEFRVSTK